MYPKYADDISWATTAQQRITYTKRQHRQPSQNTI